MGAALMRAVMEQCRRVGCKQMLAIVAAGDPSMDASLALHQALGFVRVGTFTNVGFKFSKWLHTALMQATLDP